MHTHLFFITIILPKHYFYGLDEHVAKPCRHFFCSFLIWLVVASLQAFLAEILLSLVYKNDVFPVSLIYLWLAAWFQYLCRIFSPPNASIITSLFNSFLSWSILLCRLAISPIHQILFSVHLQSLHFKMQ